MPMLIRSNSDYIAHLDGFSVISGGWLNRNWVQLGYQLADSVAGFSYSFGMTCIILFIMNFIPGLSLRVTAEEEEMGLDDGQLGEFAYDYVELARSPADAIQGESVHPRSSSGSVKETKVV
jgi:Amt family ammonium transporter